jgi:phosphoglucosamine mutase
MSFEKIAEKFNGNVIRAKVGDVYLSEMMKKKGAIFGGEPCGAWIHPQFHYCPDGPLSGVLLLKALEKEAKTLDEFISKVPKFITIRENVFCNNQSKNQTIRILKEKIKNVFPEMSESLYVDGMRVSLKNGWILIRESGTEPFIRLTVEGESLKITKDILQRGIELIKRIIEA